MGFTMPRRGWALHWPRPPDGDSLKVHVVSASKVDFKLADYLDAVCVI